MVETLPPLLSLQELDLKLIDLELFVQLFLEEYLHPRFLAKGCQVALNQAG